MSRYRKPWWRFDPRNAHPLADLVLSAFTSDRRGHDRVTIAAHLGCNFGDQAGSTNGYYRVAEDVLACLEAVGRIYRDAQGWCYRVPVGVTP